VHIDENSILPDIGGHDMQMGVAGIEMLIDEVGLVSKPDPLHISVGYFDESVAGELLGWMEIQGDMERFVPGFLVKVV
jgi:hypothetical protein